MINRVRVSGLGMTLIKVGNSEKPENLMGESVIRPKKNDKAA